MADGNEAFFYFPITANNTIADVDTAYEVTRGHHRVAYGEEARFSPILRSPLAEEYGGVPHKGLDISIPAKTRITRHCLPGLTVRSPDTPSRHLRCPNRNATSAMPYNPHW